MCVIIPTFSQVTTITPTQYSYTSFVGDHYSMLRYEGKYVNLLIPDTLVHDDATCTQMTYVFDSVWDYYYKMTKRYPLPSGQFGNKGYVAYVDNSCGAGCGNVGACGLEVGTGFWNNSYYNIKYFKNWAVLKIAYYEMGRNFFNGDISAKLSVDPFWIPEPYANMGYLNAIDYLGLYLKDQYENEIGYKYDLVDRANEFILDRNVTTIADVYEKLLYPNAYGNSDFKGFFNSALLMKFCFDYGNPFISNFFKELYNLPDVNNITEAYTNFCIAASKAVNVNLKPFFKDAYRMPLNGDRIAVSLIDLPEFSIKVVAQDKAVMGLNSKDSTIIRIKAVTGQNSRITYTVYEGQVGNESKLLKTTSENYFYIPNKKFDTTFWVKATDALNSTSSLLIKYSYRGNLLGDPSFEIAPNTYPINSPSSIEATFGQNNWLLSAVRDSLIHRTGQYSLNFNHTHYQGCENLTGMNFPNIDYSQSFNEPLKGRYRASAYIRIKEQFEYCPNVISNAGMKLQVIKSGILYQSSVVNNISETFSSLFFDFDSGQDTSKINGYFFQVLSDGIKGEAFVDDISVKPIFPPEPISVFLIKGDTSRMIVITQSESNNFVIKADSAQDITVYQILISRDTLFGAESFSFESHSNSLTASIGEIGKYYIRAYGFNEFGKSVDSSYKILNVVASSGVDNEELYNLVEVYPNPSSGEVTITIPPQTSKVQIYSAEGNLIREIRIADPDGSIKCSFPQSGIYILRVYSGDQVISKKVVIQNQ